MTTINQLTLVRRQRKVKKIKKKKTPILKGNPQKKRYLYASSYCKAKKTKFCYKKSC